ncbi:aspartate aminotransferase family protein [Massilia forsythiae]|uniref:Diaminobutyrate--2-oxoglutarate transaminase n=1 Tax=Massilia forsythiae TaxID=2728020 RepID=A0A7Z2VWP9_9BURK|nr:aspartate aminotransferase family protein [Massilia forsythiae]QJE00525.1 aspartate aminotransferase family protein [Massilia forsythiae]
MSHILHRSLRHMPPVAVGGEGIYLRDRQGRTCIDAGAGAGVCSLGYGQPDILAAMRRQIDRCAYAHTGFFTSDAAEELAERLVARAPAGIGGVYLVSGGAEAMEAALKLARQYFVEAGELRRSVFIARRQSDHGHTLGALALGGNESRRRPFAALLMDVPRVSPCYEYRGRPADQDTAEYTASLLDELEATILHAGPDHVIAFCAEPVAGIGGGAVPPTPGYFRGVRALCDKYGILFIADEATCGMGRTGTLFALEQDGVAPDLVTLAKGLGAGYAPIGAVLVNGAIVERLRAGSGAFSHGHTCSGHPVAAAAALAVQDVIERDDLLIQVQKRGATLRRMLGDVFGGHEHVGDIRGRGLLMGLELVRNRATRAPFAPELKLHALVRDRALEAGLLVAAAGGTVDGRQGDHVLLAPPFIASAAQLSEIVARLKEAIDAALMEVVKEAQVGCF